MTSGRIGFYHHFSAENYKLYRERCGNSLGEKKFFNVLMYLLSVSTASTTIPALMWRFCVKCRSEDYCSKCGSQTPNLEYIMPKSNIGWYQYSNVKDKPNTCNDNDSFSDF